MRTSIDRNKTVFYWVKSSSLSLRKISVSSFKVSYDPAVIRSFYFLCLLHTYAFFLQYSAVHNSSLQYLTIQHNTVHNSSVQFITLHCSTVITVHYITAKYSSKLYSKGAKSINGYFFPVSFAHHTTVIFFTPFWFNFRIWFKSQNIYNGKLLVHIHIRQSHITTTSDPTGLNPNQS